MSARQPIPKAQRDKAALTVRARALAAAAAEERRLREQAECFAMLRDGLNRALAASRRAGVVRTAPRRFDSAERVLEEVAA